MKCGYFQHGSYGYAQEGFRFNNVSDNVKKLIFVIVSGTTN